MRGHELRSCVNWQGVLMQNHVKQGYLYVGTNLSVTPCSHKFEWHMCWYCW